MDEKKLDPATIPDPAEPYDPTQEVVRHKHRRKPRRRVLRIVFIALAVFVVACGGIALYVNHAIQSGKEKLLDSTNVTVKDAVAEGLVEVDGTTYYKNDSAVSIAVIGFDRRNMTDTKLAGQADTLMVVAIDTETGEMSVIVVPRDSMVLVDRYSNGTYLGQDTEQICLQFSYGDGYHTSCEYTADALSRVLLGMPISYYFALDMNGIAPINDAVGGVYLTPIESIPGTGIEEGSDILLYGQNATKYVQYRDTSVDGSALDRQKRQEQYIKAFVAKALSNAKGGDISSLLELYNAASEYSVTNLGIDEFSYLATLVASGSANDLNLVSLQGAYGEKTGSFGEFQLDSASVQEAVLSVYYEAL